MEEGKLPLPGESVFGGVVYYLVVPLLVVEGTKSPTRPLKSPRYVRKNSIPDEDLRGTKPVRRGSFDKTVEVSPHPLVFRVVGVLEHVRELREGSCVPGVLQAVPGCLAHSLGKRLLSSL